jgi:hypothetical protein
MSFSETLVISTDSSVVDPVSLLLTFDKITDTNVPAMNQIAWRVLNFGGPGQTASAQYQQNLFVCNTQISTGNLVYASAYKVLALGQESTLQKSGAGYAWTNPAAGNAGLLTGINDSGVYQNIGVGTLNGSEPDPLLVWSNVGNGNNVQALFTPVLSIFATAQYQQTELITGEIVSPVLWNKNLALLPMSITDLTLSQDSSGTYSISPSSVPRPGAESRRRHDKH